MKFLDSNGVSILKKYIDYEAGEVIIGTQTAATGAWTGKSRLATASDLKSGYRFTYWLPYAGSGDATLKLTFKDNTTKTINLYLKSTTRLTTHMGAGTKIDFTYLESVSINGTNYTGAWMDPGYDTSNTYTQTSHYERKYIYSTSAPLYRYKLCGYRDGRIVPLVVTNQTDATIVQKTPTTIGLDINKGIVYYNTTTAVTSTTSVIAAQTILNENALSTATYTFNTNVPVYCDIYLKGTYKDGLFYLDTTSKTSWYVYAPANSTSATYNAVFEEGSYYVFVGPSYSSANYFELKNYNPLYLFQGGQLTGIESRNILNTTYSGLVTLRNNSALSPGSYYRITDYVTTTTYAESRSAGHPFDVLVLATSESTLSEDAFALQHEGDTYFSNSDLSAWKLKYCLDNDTERFSWADTTNGKGVIYRMIDENNNSLAYDFKNIQFKRYKVTPKSQYTDILPNIAGLYVGYPQTYAGTSMIGLDYDSADYHWYYTFSWLASDLITPTDASLTKGPVGNMILGDVDYDVANKLDNNVFMIGPSVTSYVKNINSESLVGNYADNTHCYENFSFVTVFGGISNNVITSQFRNNIIFGAFRHMELGSDIQNNLFVGWQDICFWKGHQMSRNIFATPYAARNELNNIADNVISVTNGGQFSTNIISYFTYNIINSTGPVSQNTFGTSFNNNTFNCSRFVGNSFIATQHKGNVFNGQIVDCVFRGILEYIVIPSNGDKYFAYNDIGTLRGTSTANITLELEDLFLSEVKNVKRRINVEGTSGGKIVATWKNDTGQTVGYYKTTTATTWTAISSGVTGSGLTDGKIVVGDGGSSVKISGYGVSNTAPNSSSTDSVVPTSKAVNSAISTALTSVLKYKGTIGTGGTVTSLPASHSVGDVYVVSTAGTYAGKACEVGDYIICKTAGTSANNAHWDVVNGENQVENKSASLAAAGSSATIATVDGTNLTITTPSTWTGLTKTGTVTSITLKATSPISIDSSNAITTSGTRTFSHANSGVTAGTYRSVTVNATGHVTAGTNPTTLSGYGITDAKIDSGTITLGSNTITPLTSSSTLDATKLTGTIPASCYTNTTYSVAKYDTLGLLKPAYTSTGAATLTTAAATNTSTPTIAAKTTTSGRYYAVEADKNGVAFVNVPWTNVNSSYLTSHQSLGLVAGASGTATNAATSNGSTYLKVLGGGAYKGQVKITGATNVSVSSDANGVITITGPSLSGYATTSSLGNYLPLAGGTMNGDIDLATKTKSIVLATAPSWSSSERTIPFSANGEPSKMTYYSDNANTGLTFNPNTGALKAASFVKRGGTSSQFLKADGSVDSTAYLPLTGGTLTGDLTAPSMHFSDKYYLSIANAAGGWYRIGQCAISHANGGNILLFINRGYGNANNESYVFSISIAYNGAYCITQLSGVRNNVCISKIRLDYTTGTGKKPYIDFYYTADKSNTVYIKTIGDFVPQTPALVESLTGIGVEFETASGLKVMRTTSSTTQPGVSGGTCISTNGQLISLGNVGIGTTSPSYKLHVNGTGAFANAITLTGTTDATRRIYFGDTSHYIELTSEGFHFSHKVYSDGDIVAFN